MKIENNSLLLTVLLSALSSSYVHASKSEVRVAVIDSGLDYQHPEIKDKVWMNPNEKLGAGRDYDKNGYQDDVYGWNFAEDNNQVIDYRYLERFQSPPSRFFEVQNKMIRGTASEQELAWLKEQMKNQETIQNLQVFGNFAHGTHVTGIAMAGEADASKVLTVKLIPTEVKLPFKSSKKKKKESEKEKIDPARPLQPFHGVLDSQLLSSGFQDRLLKKVLHYLASTQMNMLAETARYVNSHKADVANGSFGTGYKQAKMITDAAFRVFFWRAPREDESKEYAVFFINSLVAEGARMANAAKETLFVFAAGNDGSNNDEFPASPTNIKAPNTISVAATVDRVGLAKFSNYGVNQVEVAAPGVGIESLSPGGKRVMMSGTSQAAPYVANVARQIKATNSELTPAQIKRILMETVDYKKFLAGQVKSGGIVNTSRAVLAAELSKSMDLLSAIKTSRGRVADESANMVLAKNLTESIQVVFPLPTGLRQVSEDDFAKGAAVQ